LHEGPSTASRGTPIRLREVAPGRFEARTPIGTGTSVVTVEAPFDETLTTASVTVRHSYPASIGDARHDLVQLERLVEASSASMVRTSDGSGVAAWSPAASITLDTQRSHIPWLAIAGAAWLGAIMIRYGLRFPWANAALVGRRSVT